MKKPASPSRTLVSGMVLAVCLMALWFWRSGGTHPQTAPDGAPVSPSPVSSEPQVGAAAGGEQGEASPASRDRSEPSLPRGVNGTNLYLKAS